MTGHTWLDVVLGALAALALTWLLLVIALAVGRPRGKLLSESLRLLPDLLRLLRRLAADKTQPIGVRVRLGLLLVYLATPIDLIPDFIPVLGYLDDLIIVPAGIMLAVRLIPDPLMREFRQEALRREGQPKSYAGAALIAAIWIITAAWLIWLFWPGRAN